MLYVCKSEFEQALGLKPNVPLDVMAQMLASSDIEPVYAATGENFIKITPETEQFFAENVDSIGYVVIYPIENGKGELPATSELCSRILKNVRAKSCYYQIVYNYQQALRTAAAPAIQKLKELTGVEFYLHMSRLNEQYTGRWHMDVCGSTACAMNKDERELFVSKLTLNCRYVGGDLSFIEVKDRWDSQLANWSSSKKRQLPVFLNPRDTIHRVVVEDSAEMETMLFRTAELSVEQFRDILASHGLLEGEARP